MTDPVIPRSDIESALAKVKAYVAAGKPGEIKMTPADWLGELMIYTTLPKETGFGAANKNEVAALTRALQLQDPKLATQIVYYNAKTGETYLNMHVNRWVDVFPNEYNRDETARLARDGKEFEKRLADALEKISKADPAKLADQIEQKFASEQLRVNEAYERARTATQEAFRKNDHVGVMIDRAYSLGFTFQYLGAIDGAVDSGKFGANATGPSEIQFDTPNSYVQPFKAADKKADHVYSEAVKRAFEVQQNAAGADAKKVYGIVNVNEGVANRDELLTNDQKRTIGIGVNIKNLLEYKDHMAKTQGATLTLNSNQFLFPEDAVVLSGIRHIAENPNHVKYYAARYQDKSPGGPHSEEKLLKRYANPGIDIGGNTRTEEIMYVSQEMLLNMYEEAKEAYRSKAAEKQKIPPLHGVTGYGEERLANNAPAAPASRTVAK